VGRGRRERGRNGKKNSEKQRNNGKELICMTLLKYNSSYPKKVAYLFKNEETNIESTKFDQLN
jgi:hypothetical protein